MKKAIITICTLISFLLACEGEKKAGEVLSQEEKAPHNQIRKKYGMNDPYINLTQYIIENLSDSGLGALVGTEKIVLNKERPKPSILEFYDSDGDGKADATLFKIQVRGGEYKIVSIGLIPTSKVYKKLEPQLKGIAPFDPLLEISP